MHCFTRGAEEVSIFEEEHSGTIINSIYCIFVGAIYLSQVLGSSSVLDEAEWMNPIVTVFVVTAIANDLTVIDTSVYFKKRKFAPHLHQNPMRVSFVSLEFASISFKDKKATVCCFI